MKRSFKKSFSSFHTLSRGSGTGRGRFVAIQIRTPSRHCWLVSTRRQCLSCAMVLKKILTGACLLLLAGCCTPPPPSLPPPFLPPVHGANPLPSGGESQRNSVTVSTFG